MKYQRGKGSVWAENVLLPGAVPGVEILPNRASCICLCLYCCYSILFCLFHVIVYPSEQSIGPPMRERKWTGTAQPARRESARGKLRGRKGSEWSSDFSEQFCHYTPSASQGFGLFEPRPKKYGCSNNYDYEDARGLQAQNHLNIRIVFCLREEYVWTLRPSSNRMHCV